MLLKNQVIALALTGGLAGGAYGCRCLGDRVETRAVEPPPSPVEAGVPERCRAVVGPSLRLQAGAVADSSSEKVPAGAPFSVELGSAVSFEGGYAVSWLSGQAARLTLVSERLDAARVIDLGRVPPSATPPVLSLSGEVLLVALGAGSASQAALKVAQVGPDAVIRWGGAIAEDQDESKAIALASASGNAVLGWDAWDETRRRSQIQLASFSASDPGALGVGFVVSPPATDAESPRLVARSGGYWLGWIAQEPLPPASVSPTPGGPALAAPLANAQNPAPPAGEQGAPGEKSTVVVPSSAAIAAAAPEDELETPRPRWVEILRLDPRGAPEGAPLRVSEPQAALSGFDFVLESDGSVLIAWREQGSTVSVDGGQVHLVSVDPEGRLQRVAIEDSELGAGLAFFIPDSLQSAALAAGGARAPIWLAVPDAEEGVRLGAIRAVPLAATGLGSEPRLRNGTVLLRSGERLLVAEPRGRDAELLLFDCQL